MSKVFDFLIENDKFLYLEHSRLLKINNINLKLINLVKSFFQSYCDSEGCSAEDVLLAHKKFVTNYTKDLENFKKTEKYPFQLNTVSELSRKEYDLVLIISILFSRVRYHIIDELYHSFQNDLSEVCLIGVGSGIDIEVILHARKSDKGIKAFDTSLGNFAKVHFAKNIKVFEEEFSAKPGSCEKIIAIELLEHLREPYEFIKDISSCLRPDGRFIFTTATDMPQFDHLYNFQSDDELKNRLNQYSLKIVSKKDYYHHYFGGPETAKNSWYEVIRL